MWQADNTRFGQRQTAESPAKRAAKGCNFRRLPVDTTGQFGYFMGFIPLCYSHGLAPLSAAALPLFNENGLVRIR